MLLSSVKTLRIASAVVLGVVVSLGVLGAVYNQFSPGGALSGTWNSQNVNVAAGAPFIAGTLPSGNGGTGNTFFAVSGPASSTKTYTFPNASTTMLTTNAAVTLAQGGTGLTSASDDTTLISNGTAWSATSVPNCGDSTHALAYSTSTNLFSCQSVTGSGGTPAGSDTQVQFNNSGAFGADADFTWTSATNVLTVGSVANQASITAPTQGSGAGLGLTVTGSNSVTTGNGGSVVLKGGNAGTGTNGNGGNATVASGLANGAGANGVINFRLGTSTINMTIDGDGSWDMAGTTPGTSGQVLTSNGSATAPSWQTVSTGAALTTGSWTTTLTTGCTTQPTQNWTYTQLGSGTGSLVTITSQATTGCTSNAGTLTSASGSVPSAIRPSRVLHFTGLQGTNSGANAAVCLSIASDGTLSYLIQGTTTNECGASSFNASGAKGVNLGTSNYGEVQFTYRIE
jgi:hypothetical protein